MQEKCFKFSTESIGNGCGTFSRSDHREASSRYNNLFALYTIFSRKELRKYICIDYSCARSTVRYMYTSEQRSDWMKFNKLICILGLSNDGQLSNFKNLVLIINSLITRLKLQNKWRFFIIPMKFYILEYSR